MVRIEERPDTVEHQPATGRGLRILGQVAAAVGFYAAYVGVRDFHGNRTMAEHTDLARQHGIAIYDLERRLHLDVELSIQHAVLRSHDLTVFINVLYGSCHFIVTAGVFFGLLAFAPAAQFRRARNTLALTTGLALATFALYPTMPPRLLPPQYGYVDTMSTVGGLWSYNNGVMEHISDPFAAMPSLHIAWSTWCALSLGSVIARRRWRLALMLYPLCTAFVVLGTGTHWLLDLFGGLLVLLVARAVVSLLSRANASRARQRVAARLALPGA